MNNHDKTIEIKIKDPLVTVKNQDGQIGKNNKGSKFQGREKALFVLTGLAGIVILSIVAFGVINETKEFASATIIVAFCATIVGGLIGFLFGIPRTNQVDQNEITIVNNFGRNGHRNVDERYSFNTNLEQISDWLTKILIGVGLTQLYKLGDTIDKISRSILGDLNEGSPKTGASLLSVTIVCFLIYGFMVGYLWTRLYYHHLLAKADNSFLDEVNRKLASLEKKTKTANEKAETAETIAKKAKYDAKKAQSTATFGVGKSTTSNVINETKKKRLALLNESFGTAKLDLVKNEKDPNKGRFDGRSETKDRKLTAQVTHSPTLENLFNVHLKLESINENNPLSGVAKFYLHDSFREPVYPANVIDGKAALDLTTFGAFTVGVIADGGETKLELDLKELPDAPLEFKNH
ncbi:pYEATS domain-containing protein [Adhaeribacter soli]|uniref:Prokaryotic YEATS domain-containing protein n=1 Tax=Adhaeribacter soli TaxID=2607655 RepID=A0A5N1INE8_9BACT|nr:pYEATS domain-containing protein [Adhaeribacter soli]KAA9325010.1 hypothetical protein F0P94_19060 [Adhaeribacter soli]